MSAEAERAEYDLHQNHPSDPHYRKFLSRLADPLLELLRPSSQGLDFGCGPGPTLSVMLEEAGHEVSLYDPFYIRNPEVWLQKYDFATASEVLEHLHHPGFELDRLWSALNPGGWLGVLTQPLLSLEAFRSWRYKDDSTHVAFFSEATFRFLASHWGARLLRPSLDVALFEKG